MKDLERRLEKIEQAMPDPARDYQWLEDLGKMLLEMSKDDKIEWIKVNLAGLEEEDRDSWLHQLLTDWIDFLNLQNNPAKDPITKTPPPEQIKWGEIHKRWGWSGWTGAGLPPQLQPGHWDFALE